MSTNLDDIAYRAQQQPAVRFTALAHHLTEEFLEETWQMLNAHGAPGLSGETMAAYARVRRFRIAKLVERLKAHAYRVPPIRRVYIPKPGQPQKLRPLGIPEVEDRLLQAAVSRLLTPIYEADFRDSSYGFRPGRSPHDALRAVEQTVMRRPCQGQLKFLKNDKPNSPSESLGILPSGPLRWGPSTAKVVPIGVSPRLREMTSGVRLPAGFPHGNPSPSELPMKEEATLLEAVLAVIPGVMAEQPTRRDF